jgi:putative glutamine transport system substrate-binding protein
MSVENPGYTVVGGSFTKEPYGIAVNKGQDKFRHRLNKALTTLEKNGTYNRILKKWFGNVQGFNYEEMKR